MEKIVLSKGYEFELVTNGVNVSYNKNSVAFTFIPGEYTVEQLLTMWDDNDTITVKIDDTSVRVFDNYTVCGSVSVVPNYLIRTKFTCPECGTEVEATATTCPNCNAAFESPNMEEVRATVSLVKVQIPDINDRMNDAEDSIEDIINTILG